jgi:hypothetical protein
MGKIDMLRLRLATLLSLLKKPAPMPLPDHLLHHRTSAPGDALRRHHRRLRTILAVSPRRSFDHGR